MCYLFTCSSKMNLVLTMLRHCAEKEVAAREHRRRQQMESQLKQRKMTRAVHRSARYGKPLGLVGVSKAGNPYRVLPPVADAHTAQLFCDATAQLASSRRSWRATAARRGMTMRLWRRQPSAWARRALVQRTAARRREGLHGTACAPDAGAAQALGKWHRVVQEYRPCRHFARLCMLHLDDLKAGLIH